MAKIHAKLSSIQCSQHKRESTSSEQYDYMKPQQTESQQWCSMLFRCNRTLANIDVIRNFWKFWFDLGEIQDENEQKILLNSSNFWIFPSFVGNAWQNSVGKSSMAKENTWARQEMSDNHMLTTGLTRAPICTWCAM